MSSRSYKFKSEARQLLDLMIHSLYSNKEIFLRELISNASDALDKLRVEALSDKDLVPVDHEYRVRISFDKEARTLSVDDSGIGMSREEAIENLGTIAHSGTRAFLDGLQQAQQGSAESQANFIGQFGVGFYSVFMVADRVEVLTRRAGQDEATLWTCDGGERFKVADAERAAPGSTVTLHLKPADTENNLPDYADEWTLRRTIKTYSDFVTYPIQLEVQRKAEPAKDGEQEATPAADEPTHEWQTVNSMKAIWARAEDDVTEEEYNEFYKHISRDWVDPLQRIRLSAEGTFEYKALLFVPKQAPYDLYQRDMKYGLQLFVQRVLIMEHCQDLLPQYLRFLRGVVESPDLSLNVSREILQQDRRVGRIRKRIVKKVLDTLGDLLREDREKYLEFWASFGGVLKEGMAQDFENRERLQKLMLFPSTRDAEALTGFAEYIERMPEGQDSIYYITGDSRAAVEHSPHLEAFRDKGYEVLFLVDAVDEFLADSIQDIDGKSFKSVGKGAVELGSEEERKAAEEKLEQQQQEHASLLEAMKGWLAEHVKEVRLSTRLKTSAACLVSDEGDMTPGLERMLAASGHAVPQIKRILEVNPDHELLQAMHKMYGEDRSNDTLQTYAELLYGQALLAEGSTLPDPVSFSRKVADLMLRAAG